jgi:hypothetical protein
MLDTPPERMDMENASRDALAALHLNQYNTGLGNNRALHDLYYSELTGDERAEQIEKAKSELAEEAKVTAAAQVTIGASYRQAINAERIIYACACCGLLNFSTTGEFRRMSLGSLEPLRYTGSAADTERWARITHAHALTEAESGKRYDCVFNYYPPMAPPMAPHAALPPIDSLRKVIMRHHRENRSPLCLSYRTGYVMSFRDGKERSRLKFTETTV